MNDFNIDRFVQVVKEYRKAEDKRSYEMDYLKKEVDKMIKEFNKQK